MSDVISWVRGVEPECQQLSMVHNAVSVPAEMNYAIQTINGESIRRRNCSQESGVSAECLTQRFCNWH